MSNEIENVDEYRYKLFPSKDESLCIFKSIDEATQEWLKSLNHIWKIWKTCDVLSKTLIDYFNSAPNPYLSTLRILVNIPDFNHIKTNSSLAFTVIEEYSKWLMEDGRKESYEHLLALDLKLATFQLIIKQNNMEFIKLVATTYDLNKHKDIFLNTIKDVIYEKKYKEAAQYAVILQLQECFPDPESLALPLILQNKITVVEEFLADCPTLQKNLVVYLDDLIGQNDNIQSALNHIIRKNEIPDTKMSITERPMIKLVARLVKLYNLPPECCPNLNKKRSAGALQFLIHKRYVEYSLSTASWREMVEEAVGNDRKLQLTIVRMLINMKDAGEALFWAKKFNIPKEQWPWAVSYEEEQNESEGINEGASTSKMSDWENNDDSVNYHELKLSKNSIKIVNNPSSFEEFLDNGLKGVCIVGIDSEWKPCFGTKQTELALIQIATKDSVYILDVTTMGNEFVDLWNELSLCLFENKSILKLGFGIAQDMTVIRNSLLAISKVKTYGEGYLDIVQLWKKLVEDYKYKFVFPHESNDHVSKKSLSKLVELCLGQKLNKSDQFSNWEQRPLRESQIIYAALDAYCLLEVYETFEMQCDQLDIPFYDICLELQHIPNQSPRKNMKRVAQKPHIIRNGPLNCGTQQNLQRNPLPGKFSKFWKQNDQNGQSFNKPSSQTHSTKPVYLNRQHCVNTSEHVKQGNWESKAVETFPQKTRSKYTPAHKWRVICDSMLVGLSAKLRMCGCDCTYLMYDQGLEQSVKIAINENRVFLTRNKGYLKFARYLPPAKSYLLLADTTETQLQEVLNYFGIVIMQRNIFSRCIACNCNEFAKVPKLLMDKLIKSYVQLTRKTNYHIRPDLTNELDKIINLNSHDLKDSDFKSDDEQQREDRTWTLNTDSVNVDTCSTKYHVKIQINKVPIQVLKHIKCFLNICERCGKIYWNGSNLERTFRDLIKDFIVDV